MLRRFEDEVEKGLEAHGRHADSPGDLAALSHELIRVASEAQQVPPRPLLPPLLRRRGAGRRGLGLRKWCAFSRREEGAAAVQRGDLCVGGGRWKVTRPSPFSPLGEPPPLELGAGATAKGSTTRRGSAKPGRRTWSATTFGVASLAPGLRLVARSMAYLSSKGSNWTKSTSRFSGRRASVASVSRALQPTLHTH
mmetsp:Transcript_43230/g.97703  ORF Transcript_43230/g.97703 Transcript_43230/m.97703 type:complete len:195 (-) Transcript_43230:61-645(-)